MGWKTGHARLTPEEAKAHLLAIADERSATSLVGRYPLRALVIALAAGFLVAKTARFWAMAGSGGMWLVQQIIPLPMKARQTPLDRLKAHTRRRR